MSEGVTQSGSSSTLDQAAQQLESLLEAADVTEEVTDEAIPSEVEYGDPEDQEDESEESEAEEADEAPDAEEEEDEGSAIESLTDLAEALETPLDELLASLKHTIKVGGEEQAVTLSELQTGYQKGSDYAKQTEALKAEREQFEAFQAQQRTQFEQEHAVNADILNTFEQALANQINGEDMAQLRATDQQAWLMRRYELEDQLNGIRTIKQEAAQRYAQAAAQIQQQQEQARNERLATEMELRNKAIPNWDNSTGENIARYLVDNIGFSMDEVTSAFTNFPDHRQLVLAHKAMMYDQGMKEAKDTTKKVKKKPALVKPSRPKGIRRDAVKEAKSRLRKSGNLRDAGKVIESMI